MKRVEALAQMEDAASRIGHIVNLANYNELDAALTRAEQLATMARMDDLRDDVKVASQLLWCLDTTVSHIVETLWEGGGKGWRCNDD